MHYHLLCVNIHSVCACNNMCVTHRKKKLLKMFYGFYLTGKHNRVSFIEDTSPPRTRSTSPVLPAVRTHHRMKDLATTATV